MYEPQLASTVQSCLSGRKNTPDCFEHLIIGPGRVLAGVRWKIGPITTKVNLHVCSNTYLKSNTCKRLWQRASAAWWTFSTRLRKVCRCSFGYLCKYLHAVLIWLVSENGHLARTLTIAARAKLSPVIWMGVHEEHVNTVSTSGLPSRMQIFKQDAVS